MIYVICEIYWKLFKIHRSDNQSMILHIKIIVQMMHCVKCCSKCIYTYRRWMCNRGAGTGWRRLIGYPKLQVIFHKRATKYRSLLRKMTYRDKGSYESSPPCTAVANSMQSQHSREMHPLVRLVGFICWSPFLFIIYICIKQGCCASTAVANWTQIQLKDTFPRATYVYFQHDKYSYF